MRSPGVYRVCRPAGKFRCVPGKDHPIIEEYCRTFRDKGKNSGSTPSGGTLMLARGTMRTPCAFFIVAILLMVAIQAEALDGKYRYPLKVRVSERDSGRFSDVASARAHSGNVGATVRDSADWEVAAGQARREILCPKRGFNFAIGMRPYFATLTGATKVASRGGEGGFLSLIGHLRIPPESTLWEFYGAVRAWDKVTVHFDYLPWHWGGPGHTPIEANFGGLLLKTGDFIQSDINIASLVLGADYDVSFSRDLIFGPNADLHLIKLLPDGKQNTRRRGRGLLSDNSATCHRSTSQIRADQHWLFFMVQAVPRRSFQLDELHGARAFHLGPGSRCCSTRQPKRRCRHETRLQTVAYGR